MGNRGDDTIRLLGGVTKASVKGGEQNDTIYLEGALSTASVYGGAGNDSVTYNDATGEINATVFQDGSGNNNFDITAQSFVESSVVAGSGSDTIDLTSTNAISKASLRAQQATTP